MDKSDINHDSGIRSGPIETAEFLNFLKLACRVHESIILKDDSDKTLDYNSLAKNEFVDILLNSKSGQSPKSNGIEDGEKNGEYFCKYETLSILSLRKLCNRSKFNSMGKL